MIRSLLLASLLLFTGESFALQCVKTGTVCADADPYKTISGVKVYLTDPAINATCWKYTDTYNCLAQNPVDYCSAIGSTPGCKQVDSVCSTPGATPGSCLKWTNTYQCGASTAARSNTMVLDSSYTVASDPTSATQCASATDNPTCALAEIVNGARSYTCISQQSNCAALQSQGCTLSTSVCVSPSGGTAANCNLYEKSYSCPAAGPASTVLDCGAQQYCTGGNCFNSGHDPDTDLALAVSAQEVSRQGMAYLDPGQRLFSGEDGSCVHNSLGKCCDPKGGAIRNKQVGGRLLLTTYSVQSVIAGSAYMYDALSTAYNAYRGGAAMAAAAKVGMSAASAAGAAAASSAYSVSAYGLSMTYTAGTATAASSFSFAFDPTSLAVAVAIMVIIDLSSCEEPEKVLAMKQGAGLCRQYSATCNGYFCTSITKRFCCFNSKLAKIINTAAVDQLGKAISDCTGLTMDEFGRLNFAAIDLGEFTAEIMANLELPASPASGTSPIGTDVNAAILRKLNNYYTTGKQ